MADDAGPLLRRAGLLHDEQLLLARQAQAREGGTIAEQLVLGGYVDDDELTRFFQQRMMLPRVNPNDLARITNHAISTIPPDMAAEFRVIPIRIDREKNLTVAMSDPTNTHAVDEIAFFTAHYVVRAVATQRQIAWCLAHYYGFVTELGQTLMEPSDAPEEPEEPEEIVIEMEAAVPEPIRSRAGLTGEINAQRHHALPPTSDEPDDTRLAEGTGSRPLAAPEESQPDDWARSEKTSPTGPMRAMRAVQPPELEPRAGEVLAPDEDDHHSVDSLPAVVILNTPVKPVPEPVTGTESQPIVLLTAKKPSAVPEATVDPPSDSVVILDKPRIRRRSAKHTRMGLGHFSALPPGATPAGSAPEGSSIADAAMTATRRAAARRAAADTGAHHRPEKDSRPLFEAVAGVRIVADEVPNVGEDEGPEEIIEADNRADDSADDSAAGDSAAPVRVIDDNADTQSHESTGKFQRVQPNWDGLDDGWGPPGSTIPPQYLGASPGALDEETDSSAIPLDTREADDTGVVEVAVPPADRTIRVAVPPPSEQARPRARLKPAAAQTGDRAAAPPPKKPQATAKTVSPASKARPAIPKPIIKGAPVSKQMAAVPQQGSVPTATPIAATMKASIPASLKTPPTAPTPAPKRPAAAPEVRSISPASASELLDNQRMLEASSLQLVETLRELDRALTRDAIISTLLDYMRSSHGRACFFLVNGGKLSTFRNKAAGLPSDNRDAVSMKLDEQSTFQDVVRTRLAYNGAVKDERSRAFLVAAVGRLPDSIVALPVAVRDRVIGVVYGDKPQRRVFNEHAAVVSRAAGQAFERILKAKRR